MPIIKSKRYQKIEYRENKKGNILKIVREQYLRNDIHCGCSFCERCHQSAFKPKKFILNGDESTQRAILLDTSVVWDQLDFLTHPLFKNVIVLRTVLDALKRKSLAQYNNLRGICDDFERSFYVFSNENMR